MIITTKDIKLTNQTDLLNIALKRAVDKNLPYYGELSPRETFDLLSINPAIVLVDVRSLAELELVGRVPNSTHIQWAFYPGMLANKEFADQLLSQIDKDLPIIFMCRTGGRSHHAAVLAQQLGYKAFNMTEGFEGAANTLNQRTTVNGWRHAGLPWTN